MSTKHPEEFPFCAVNLIHGGIGQCTPMKFIDETTVEVWGGDGGNGCCSFRREKCVPKGGPDGGNGGRGGSVIVKASAGLSTLLDAHYMKHIRADRGGHGMGKQMNGAAGSDAVIRVPSGTIVRDEDMGEIIADLTGGGMEAVVAGGGRGGRGNMNFATSTNQAPRRADEGEKGVHRKIRLELKLLADVGLVGFPNAGKSTLISVISNARPKIADYPFTTKVPCLGIVSHKGKSFSVADIPGLIEGAHNGSGLGMQFLRHIDRTRILVHIIDLSQSADVLMAYKIIRNELGSYSKAMLAKPEVVVLSKTDIPEVNEQVNIAKKKLKKMCSRVVELSAATGNGISGLLDVLISV